MFLFCSPLVDFGMFVLWWSASLFVGPPLILWLAVYMSFSSVLFSAFLLHNLVIDIDKVPPPFLVLRLKCIQSRQVICEELHRKIKHRQSTDTMTQTYWWILSWQDPAQIKHCRQPFLLGRVRRGYLAWGCASLPNASGHIYQPISIGTMRLMLLTAAARWASHCEISLVLLRELGFCK